jgi:hypothetical protein
VWTARCRKPLLLAGPLARVSVVPICAGAFLGSQSVSAPGLTRGPPMSETGDLVLVFRRISARLVASGLVATQKQTHSPGEREGGKHMTTLTSSSSASIEEAAPIDDELGE